MKWHMDIHMEHRHTWVGVDADGSPGFHDGGGPACMDRCRHTAHRTGEHPQ